MAHIPDGIVSAPVLITGTIFTLATVSYGIRKLDIEQIPQTALLAATCFIVSLIAIPVGPSSVHLLLNGLLGLMLGWAAVPAILIALLLQALFFGYGGLVVLGVNTANLALPALLCGLLFTGLIRRSTGNKVFWIGALAGGFSALLTGVLVSSSIAMSGTEYQIAASVVISTYLPLILAEAVVTGATISFLKRVSPDRLFNHVPNPV